MVTPLVRGASDLTIAAPWPGLKVGWGLGSSSDGDIAGLDPFVPANMVRFVESLRKADPTGSLPRLAPEAYRRRAVVFWTHTVADRSTGWLDAGFHAAFRESLLHASIREQLLCPIYTLMPDHFHLIWMGVAEKSDQRLATRFLREQLAPLLSPADWQHQPHDRVLRDKERMRQAFAQTVRYITENPVRAGLVGEASAWPYTGSLVPGYPDLRPLEPEFWGRFWRLHQAAIGQGAVGKLSLYGAGPAISRSPLL